MTSEVAVMNKVAVALAADSAVTVGRGRQHKVYNGANKVFMLSRSQPVGIMVYNNGSLLGVPWETLIKAFRDEFGGRKCEKLQQYADAFLKFINDLVADLFDAKLQKRFFLSMIEAEFREIADVIRDRIVSEERKAPGTQDRKEMMQRVVTEEIRIMHNEWIKLDDDGNTEAGLGSRLTSECSGEVSDLIGRIFRADSWQAGYDDVKLLQELAASFVQKDAIAHSTLSGLVFAGFGEAEFFPVMRSMDVGEIYGGKLKIVGDETVCISEDLQSHISTFADSDMTHVFIDSISESMESHVVDDAYRAAEELSEKALSLVEPEKREAAKAAMDAARDEIMMRFVDGVEKFKADERDFEDALVYLPKDELASVAASLVNLNSFKKRLSLALETVGGPVDVAVISKGDGFIWIDRKHYFKTELNPHFLANRFKAKDSNGGADNE